MKKGLLTQSQRQDWAGRLGQATAETQRELKRSPHVQRLPTLCLAVHRMLLKLALSMLEGSGARARRGGGEAMRRHVLTMMSDAQRHWFPMFLEFFIQTLLFHEMRPSFSGPIAHASKSQCYFMWCLEDQAATYGALGGQQYAAWRKAVDGGGGRGGSFGGMFRARMLNTGGWGIRE